MTCIRKVRKAWKRKHGLKQISVHFKIKNRVICFTPTMRKVLRQSMTELFRKNLTKKNVH